MLTLAEADAEFGLWLIKNKPYDLFFIYWSTVDALGHFFWSYFDSTEPGYVPDHPFQSVIPNVYQLFDQILGEFLSSVPNDVNVMVLSDHGHGGRPRDLININEILRQSGFLFPAAKHLVPLNSWLESGIGFSVKLVNQWGFGRVAGTTLRYAPKLMRLFTRPSSIDWDRTLAFATDMSGVKAYPYGGIVINRELVKQENYEAVREDILQAVKAIFSTLLDSSISWSISRREEVYSGPFLELYPDIVLDLDPNYGLGWDIHCPLITKNKTRSLVPGSHRSETGTFLMRTVRETCVNTIDLSDVAPSILDILEISADQPFDGQSIFC
jgi:predicted AlkP superfamily phosphohydrolase/phosphomutase